MVKVSTLRGWGYSDNILGWELNEESTGEVKLVYCKLCREYYDDKKMATKVGAVKKQVEKLLWQFAAAKAICCGRFLLQQFAAAKSICCGNVLPQHFFPNFEG